MRLASPVDELPVVPVSVACSTFDFHHALRDSELMGPIDLSPVQQVFARGDSELAHPRPVERCCIRHF